MKKILILFLVFLPVSFYAEENRMSYDLKVYYIAEDETYTIYNNDNLLFTKNICNNLLNAPRFKDSIFRKKTKNTSIYVPGGYFKIVMFDDNGKRFDYHVIYEDFVYNDTDGMTYKYNFCYELYKYITYSFILNEYIPEEKKNYMMRALELRE